MIRHISLLILFIVVTVYCSAQNYSDSAEIWTIDRSYFLIKERDTLFFDKWGGKRNAVFYHLDTMIKVGDVYLGKAHFVLNKNGNFILQKNKETTQIVLTKATNEEYEYWVSLQNWIGYEELLDEIKSNLGDQLSEEIINNLKTLNGLDLVNNSSIDTYRQILYKFKKEHPNYFSK